MQNAKTIRYYYQEELEAKIQFVEDTVLPTLSCSETFGQTPYECTLLNHHNMQIHETTTQENPRLTFQIIWGFPNSATNH